MFYYGSRLSEHIVETPEGYLICMKVPINRIGTQKYRGRDIGLAGLNDDELYDVYREPEEVFSKISLASFEGKPVTDDHPVEDVDVNNYTIYEKGHGQNVSHDNEYSYADLYIKDPVLIDKIKNGKREISCGYECRFIIKDGKIYQTEIKGNHIAVVENGRAGENVRINDSQEGQNNINQLSKQLEEINKKQITLLNRLNFAKKEDKRYWEQKIPQTYRKIKNRLESLKSFDKYHNELENETKDELRNIKGEIDSFSKYLTDSKVNDNIVEVKDDTEIQNIIKKYDRNGRKISQADFTKLKNSNLFSLNELENIMLGKRIGDNKDSKCEDGWQLEEYHSQEYNDKNDKELLQKLYLAKKEYKNAEIIKSKNHPNKWQVYAFKKIEDSKCEDEFALYKYYEDKLNRFKKEPPAKFMHKAILENMSEYRQKIKDAVKKSIKDSKVKDIGLTVEVAKKWIERAPNKRALKKALSEFINKNRSFLEKEEIQEIRQLMAEKAKTLPE